ncbi:hypothetical protein OROMI_018963 [Orobanche minor]
MGNSFLFAVYLHHGGGFVYSKGDDVYVEGKEPSAYVHYYYTVQRYLEAYKYVIEPLVGEEMWPEAEGYQVKPPTVRKLSGRPKKVRRRAPEEDPKNPNKLRRFGLVMTCMNCQQKGHNSATCKNEKVPKPAKGKRGRPRKYPIQEPRPQKKGKEKTVGISNATESHVTRTKEGPSTQESRMRTASN